MEQTAAIRTTLTWSAVGIGVLMLIGAFFTTGLPQRIATAPGLGWLPVIIFIIARVIFREPGTEARQRQYRIVGYAAHGGGRLIITICGALAFLGMVVENNEVETLKKVYHWTDQMSMAVFLAGAAVICVVAYVAWRILWRRFAPREAQFE